MSTREEKNNIFCLLNKTRYFFVSIFFFPFSQRIFTDGENNIFFFASTFLRYLWLSKSQCNLFNAKLTADESKHFFCSTSFSLCSGSHSKRTHKSSIESFSLRSFATQSTGECMCHDYWYKYISNMCMHWKTCLLSTVVLIIDLNFGKLCMHWYQEFRALQIKYIDFHVISLIYEMEQNPHTHKS